MAPESYSASPARSRQTLLRRWENLVFMGGLGSTMLLLVIAELVWR